MHRGFPVMGRSRYNRIGDIMVIVLSSRAVVREFKSRSSLIKSCEIGICCFSAKHATLRSNSNDWLARIQDSVSEWSDMSTSGLLFQFANTIQIQRVLVQCKADIIIISSDVLCSRGDIPDTLFIWHYDISGEILQVETYIYIVSIDKGNNKITELRTILQRESQNS